MFESLTVRRSVAAALFVLLPLCLSLTAEAKTAPVTPPKAVEPELRIEGAGLFEVPPLPTTTTTTTAPPPPPPPVKKKAVAPRPVTPPTVAPAAPPVASGAAGDPNDPASWERLAGCESGGNWAINTGNGYYGGLQFSLNSWRGVGGTGYPHEASKATQIEMGKRLYNQGGWRHWPGCTRKFGWR